MSEDKTRLYVSHGAFLHALFIVVNEIPLEKMWDCPVDNASIMQLVEENGKNRLKLIFEGYGNRTGNVLEEE
jgi:broad specificity phosphatase PhoE